MAKLERNYDIEFQKFMKEFGRNYEIGGDEYLRRQKIFVENMKDMINTMYQARKFGYPGQEQFYDIMDWTESEKEEFFTCEESCSSDDEETYTKAEQIKNSIKNAQNSYLEKIQK